MSLIELILLAIALGIDCLIVSFCQGLIHTKNRLKNSVLLAVTMGLFQGTMPAISYLLTGTLIDYLQTYSNWIVFSIFLFLGIKFIAEALNNKAECSTAEIDFKCLIMMGIATSIDALGAGITLKLTNCLLAGSVTLIGLASFIMSQAGFWGGNILKHIPQKYLEIAGGLILIVLAFKALF